MICLGLFDASVVQNCGNCTQDKWPWNSPRPVNVGLGAVANGWAASVTYLEGNKLYLQQPRAPGQGTRTLTGLAGYQHLMLLSAGAVGWFYLWQRVQLL